MTDAVRAVKVLIAGRVQGVGFRYWAQSEAEAQGLVGWVRNRPDGNVEALFQGDALMVDRMLAACKRGPTFAAVRDLAVEETTASALSGFEIRR